MSYGTCAIEGCGRIGRLTRGWCSLHYQRWTRHGDPLGTRALRDPVCSIEGCGKPVASRCWCHMHYRRWRMHGDPLQVTAHPTRSQCSFGDCPHLAVARGWCTKHYQRWSKRGDPAIGSGRGWRGTPEERFWGVVEEGSVPDYAPGLGRCWIWTGGLTDGGYGIFTIGAKRILAHRFAYEAMVDTIPDGLVLDHLCRVVACVNPLGHLDPVPNRVNILRGYSPMALNAAKTHCPNGHPYSEANTALSISQGRVHRGCRACASPGRSPDYDGPFLHPAVINAAKTHCPAGHPYAGDNLYIIPGKGGRQCKQCKREAYQRWRERHIGKSA